MKQLILLLASLLPIAGIAAEAGDTTIVVKGKNVVIPDSVISSLLSKSEAAPHVNDTTIVVNGKNIVVSDSAGLTKVSVFGKEGEKLNRIYETSYTNGQEVQRVYVTSPFIPSSLSRNEPSLKPHNPIFFIGFSPLGGSIMSFGGNTGMHSRDSKSWEYGLTFTEMALRLTHNMILNSSLQVGQVHHHFQDNYVLSTTDGITSMKQIEGEHLKKSYISYTYVRIPVMLEWQWCPHKGPDAFVGIGPSLELRWNDHSRYRIGKTKTTETSDTNMNPIGLNLNVFAGYGALVVYARMALTPLLKTSVAPACYPFSLGVGICL